MTVYATLVRAELRLFLREPLLVFFTLAFPSILLIILGSVDDFRRPSADMGGARPIDLYVPIAVTLVLGMLALQSTPNVLAGYRERGVLRRLSTTPLRPWKLLVAQLTVSLLSAAVSVLLILSVGRLAFDVPLPAHLAFVPALVLTAAAIFSVGLVIAAIAPSGKTGNAIGTLAFFPTMFFAGLWAPRESMSPLLRRIGDVTPLGAGEQALHDAAAGGWPHAGALAVLVAYVLVFGLAAARLFRWE